MKRLVLLGLFAACPAAAGEVWVVGSSSRAVRIVDTETESAVATIPLSPGPKAGSARGISFSTVDGAAGAFAFVGQGELLHVLGADAKAWVRSVDLTSVLGLPLEIVDLESSPNRVFLGDDGAEVRAYLAIAADAVRAEEGIAEPYWIILDQRALLESAPSVPLVAASGFLHAASVPVEERGRAAGVTVMGSPFGPSHLRVWLTSRVALPPDKMRATLLQKGEELDAPWVVGATRERVLPQGRRAPENFGVAAPHDGPAQIFPEGAAGRLVDLGHAGSCELPSTNLGAVALRGPAAGGYQIVAIELDAEDLLLVNESTCGYQRFPLGGGPIDLTVDALFGHGTVWVANRDTDDVSVVRRNGTTTRVPLGPLPKGGCVECPVSIEARSGAGRGCTTELRLAQGPSGGLTWDAVGCTGVTYLLFCQCDPRLDSQCSCGCDPLQDSNCFGSLPLDGQPGLEMGAAGADGPLTPQLRVQQGSDPIFPPYPPEPVIQLGITAGQSNELGGGGKQVVGTGPPP